jgi:hypothetical protein
MNLGFRASIIKANNCLYIVDEIKMALGEKGQKKVHIESLLKVLL